MKREEVVSLLSKLQNYLKDENIQSLTNEAGSESSPVCIMSFRDISDLSEMNLIDIHLTKYKSSVGDWSFYQYSYTVYENGKKWTQTWGDAYDVLIKKIGKDNRNLLSLILEFCKHSSSETANEFEEALLKKEFYFERFTTDKVQCTFSFPLENPKTIPFHPGGHYYGVPTYVIETKWKKYINTPFEKEGKKHLIFEDWLKQLLLSWRKINVYGNIIIPNKYSLLKKEYKAIRRNYILLQRKLYWDSVKKVTLLPKEPKEKKLPWKQGNSDSNKRLVFIYNDKKDELLRITKEGAVKLIEINSDFNFIPKKEAKEIKLRQSVKKSKNVTRAFQPGTDKAAFEGITRKLRRLSRQNKSSSKSGKQGSGKAPVKLQRTKKKRDTKYVFKPHGKRFQRNKLKIEKTIETLKKDGYNNQQISDIVSTTALEKYDILSKQKEVTV